MLHTTKQRSHYSVKNTVLLFLLSVFSCILLLSACAGKTTEKAAVNTGTPKQESTTADGAVTDRLQEGNTDDTAESPTQPAFSSGINNTGAAVSFHQTDAANPETAVYGYDDDLIGVWLDTSNTKDEVYIYQFFSNGKVISLYGEHYDYGASGIVDSHWRWSDVDAVWYTENDGTLLIDTEFCDYTIEGSTVTFRSWNLRSSTGWEPSKEEIVVLERSVKSLVEIISELEQNS